jgi:hypothetical protein
MWPWTELAYSKLSARISNVTSSANSTWNGNFGPRVTISRRLGTRPLRLPILRHHFGHFAPSQLPIASKDEERLICIGYLLQKVGMLVERRLALTA